MDPAAIAGVAERFQSEIAAGPAWVRYWVDFMGIVFVLAIPFALFRAEARWAILVMILTLPFMLWLYSQVGYVKLLGLPHVVLWTPFLIYLLARRSQWRVRETLAGKWIALLAVTIFVSLVFDYADVVRFLMGERN